MNNTNEFKNEISKWLLSENEQIHLYWKGRIALYAILKAAKIGVGDEVIVPGYTCVVVPNAIFYCGATPTYVDINPFTFNATKNNIKSAITKKTKAIICQNTFGLSSEIDEIADLAKEKGILSIEDCTHGFGGTFQNKNNGTFCDAAFFSTQWNKPFSTGIGGFSYIKNKNINEAIKDFNHNLINPSFSKKTSLSLQMLVKNNILNDNTYWALVSIYRFLSRNNILLGSSSGEELSSIEIPKNYFMGMSNAQINAGIKNIQKLKNNLNIRKNNSIEYSNFLKKEKLNHVDTNLFPNHSFLKYPLLVKNKERAMLIAEKQKISLGDWLNSPIHPIQSGFEKWKININNLSKAHFAGQHIINLPTDIVDTKKTLAYLDKIKEYIFKTEELKEFYNFAI